MISTRDKLDDLRSVPGVRDSAAASAAAEPQVFTHIASSPGAAVYFSDPRIEKLAEFFTSKGILALKAEDRREEWYEDWLAFQAEHRLYASLLIPKEFAGGGPGFDLLRFARFVEVFAYFSPAHGYSLQVTLLGFLSVLMGSNPELKKQAAAIIAGGGLMAFGVSEKEHGADLLSNEFIIKEVGPDRFIANGSKYYIGNARTAAMTSILARVERPRSNDHPRRVPIALFALRSPPDSNHTSSRKIRTLGIRAAFVGELHVANYELPAGDLVAEGRDAWDAVLGAVTLGKFFLGFAAIGICEHALEEATEHLTRRVLFGKPAIQMAHIRATMTEAYVRLSAMKLYAHRALDYLHSATATDRRYLLFCAVQKARVSTEGVKVMALLSECIGAKGFEADTYFEMALRDSQLIPGLEGSTHVNLGFVAQFIPQFFNRRATAMPSPLSVANSAIASQENDYLMQAAAGGFNKVDFPPFADAFQSLKSVANVRRFARQSKAFADLVRSPAGKRALEPGTESAQGLAQCAAIIAYGQLVAENAVCLAVPTEIVSAIFHTLTHDLTASAMKLASLPRWNPLSRAMLQRVFTVPRKVSLAWAFVSSRLENLVQVTPSASTAK